MLGLLDRMERCGIEDKQSKDNLEALRSELANTQKHIKLGLEYLGVHFAEEPPKSDPKYEVWLETALRYLNRYHELIEKEQELKSQLDDGPDLPRTNELRYHRLQGKEFWHAFYFGSNSQR